MALLGLGTPTQASAACTAINFGAAPTAASIGAASEVDCYTFTGAADGEIRIRVAETSGTLVATTTVLRQNGTTVCATSTVAERHCSLDSAGTHTINVADNVGTNTGNYSIAVQRLNNPVGCTALTFGAAPSTAAISAAAEMDCYTFTGAVGDEIRLRTVRTTGTLSSNQEIVRPDGTTVCAPNGAVELTCSIDTAGQHRVIVRDSVGTNTGDYAILVQRLNSPTGCTALNFGAAPNATSIGAAAEMDCHTFSGAAGDQVRIRLMETSGTLTTQQEVVATDGTTVCFATTASEATCTLDAGGTHRIFVRDNNGPNTGNYSIAIQRLNNPTGCTALNFGAAPTATSIAAAAEMDCYSFAGAPGRRMRIRVVKTTGTLSPTQDVVDVDGALLCGPTGAQDLTCLLDGNGSHRVIVRDSAGTNTGNYSIAIQRLDSPTGCTALTYGAAPSTASLAAAAEMDCYSFNGAVGDRIRIRTTETVGTVVAMQELVRTNGSSVCGPTTAQEISCTLNVGGAHRILVEDTNGTNTGDYAIAIQRLNNPTGCTPLAYGAAPTATSIAAADEMDCFSFSGTAGHPVRIRVVKTTGTLSPIYEVVRPNGSTLCSQTGAVELTCTPDTTGGHRIIVRDSAGTNIGNYSIGVQKLNAPTGCTPLTFGAAPTAGSFSVAGEMDCFSFDAPLGSQIRVRVIETNGTAVASGEVVRPNGTTLCGPTTAAEGTCMVDSGGTHRVLLRDNNGTNTGDYVISIQRLNDPLGCTPLTFGAAPIATAIAVDGEMDCFNFTGAAGDVIRTRVIKTSGTLSPIYEIVGPNGSTVCGQTGAQESNCLLEGPGPHRVVLRDSSGLETGNYSIAVQRLNSPTGCTALTFGAAPTTSNIGANAEWECYSFSGAAGDRIRFRVAETSGALVAAQEVLAPDGNTQCFATTALETTCALESAGTHRVLVRDNNGTNTGDYSLSAQKLNAPTGCAPLTFGAAPAAANIAAAAEMDCFTFAGDIGDRIRLRLTKTTGALSPTQEVVRPNGTALCTPTGAQDLTCTLSGTGTHTIVARDSGGTATGNYVIAIQRLNNPTGCTALTIGAPAAGASISANGEMDCFSFTATAGQKLSVHVNETSGTLVAQQEIVRPNGRTLAGPSTAADLAATALGAGTYRILISDSLGTRTGNYNVSVTSP